MLLPFLERRPISIRGSCPEPLQLQPLQSGITPAGEPPARKKRPTKKKTKPMETGSAPTAPSIIEPRQERIGAVAKSSSARTVPEKIEPLNKTVRALEPCGWMPFSGLPDGPFRWGIVQRQNRGLFSLFGRWWSSAFRLTTPIFVARGPALLFGISRWLSQHGISRKRRNNLTRVLIAVERSTQSPKRTRLIHRPARDIVALDCRSDSLAFVAQIVGAISLVQRNSVPSLHMRCIITASRRASATMAFFCPRRLAMFIAHAFSHDHFCTRVSMTCAAS